jgi:HPt (histidine-containing phosphotransfer) domain-containing protein
MSLATDEYVYSVYGSDPELGGLVLLFVEEMPSRIEKLRTYAQSGEWDMLARTAHQLKGAAGSYGFHQFTPVAHRVEMAVRGKQPEEQVLQAAEELIDLCRRARTGAAQACKP